MTCRKALYPIGIIEEIWVESNYGTEIIIWTEATDSGDCSFGTELWCISEKPKSSAQSMEKSSKVSPLRQMWILFPIKWVLAPVWSRQIKLL